MQNAAKQFLEQSAAYELYKDSRKENPQKAPKLVVSKKTGMKFLSKVRLLMCFAMFVSVLSLSLYHNVAIIELGDRITMQAQQLSELEQDGATMRSRLDNAMSLSAVAEVTQNKMLMGEAENYQISYININESDVVEKAPQVQKKTFWENIIQTIIKLQAYMRES